MHSLLYIILVLSIVSASASDLELQERILDTYSRCRLDTDCKRISDNSFCHGNDAQKIGKCKCVDGYELLGRNKTHFSCLKKAGFGEECDETIQCQILLGQDAECDRTCRCSNTAHRFTDGRCYKSKLLDDICISDGECWMNDDSFGNCVNGKCTCRYDKQVPNAEKTICINARLLGEFCKDDAECLLVKNTVCREVCKCSAGYTISRNKTTCLKSATRFGENCEESDQCSAYLEGSICASNLCSCPSNYHSSGSRCVPTVRIGELCFSQDECTPDEQYSKIVNCIEGTCQCLPGAKDDSIVCRADSLHWSVMLIIMTGSILTYINYFY